MLVYLLKDVPIQNISSHSGLRGQFSEQEYWKRGMTRIVKFTTDNSSDCHLPNECRQAYCKKLGDALLSQKAPTDDPVVDIIWCKTISEELEIRIKGELYKDLRRLCGEHIHLTVEGSMRLVYKPPPNPPSEAKMFDIEFKTKNMKWISVDTSKAENYYFEKFQGQIPESVEYFWTTQNRHMSFLVMSIYFSVDDDIVTQDLYRLNKFAIDTGNILSRQLHSDVTIVTSNKAEIPAHKCFLSVGSSVFEAMLRGDFKEASSMRVEINDVSQQCIEALLEYFYTSKLSKARNDPELAMELLKAAHKYNVQPLQNLMKSIFLQRSNYWFSSDQAVDMFLFSRKVEDLFELNLKAVQVLKLKSDEFLNSDTYKDVFDEDIDARKDLVSALLKH